MEQVYEKFVDFTLDDKGILTDINFKNTDSFNFAFDVVDAMAERNPDKEALVYVSNDKKCRRFTFKEMSEYSSRAANYFEVLGIRPGDRVMLVLKRHYQFWFAMLGLAKMGAIAIPATNLLVKHDFEYRFNSAMVRAMICTSDGDVADHAEQAMCETGRVDIRMIVGGEREGWHSFDEEIEKCSPIYKRRESSPKGDDLMLMMFTSGTTKYPRIAAHSHKYPLGHFVTAKFWHNNSPDGLHFTISDTGWGKALWGKLYGQWLCGSSIFVYDYDRFKAEEILPLFKEYGITTFCAPPTMYRFFIKDDLSKYDLSSITYSNTAGEALNPQVYYDWKKATGLDIMEGFGQTETTLTVGTLVGMEPRPGSMGKPVPGYNVDIVDAEGNSCPVGETGEIVIYTGESLPCGLFTGYYLDRDSTEAVWKDGVYHTGDTAYRDGDGYYWYVGRTDDIIKSSGYRIGPFEIESVIMELPYVLECAITPVPDPIRGQIVKATVILVEGQTPSEELKKEIQNYVKRQTAPYKYPRVVEFVKEMPKTISGKIRRAEIKRMDIEKYKRS